MNESIAVTRLRTEDVDAATRASIIDVCIEAHQVEDFRNLFSYIPAGGRHFLAYHNTAVVSHAVVTTRWLQPAGQPILKTAYVDAVATLPAYQGHGYGSAVMRYLAQNVTDYTIACLATDRPTFYERLGWEAWRGASQDKARRGSSRRRSKKTS